MANKQNVNRCQYLGPSRRTRGWSWFLAPSHPLVTDHRPHSSHFMIPAFATFPDSRKRIYFRVSSPPLTFLHHPNRDFPPRHHGNLDDKSPSVLSGLLFHFLPPPTKLKRHTLAGVDDCEHSFHDVAGVKNHGLYPIPSLESFS